MDMGAYEKFNDCNGNDIPDAEEIANGTSDDCDNNGIPDECETHADSDGDGVPDCTDQCNGVDDAIFAPECVGAIPTVSEWGLVVLALILLVAGKIQFGWQAGSRSNTQA